MYVNMMLVISRLTAKCQEDQAEHVEGSQQSRQQTEGVQNVATLLALKRCKQNGVFREKAGKERNARDSESREEHRGVSSRNLFAEAAHVAHVLLAAHGVNHAARCKEEQRLEERVRHQVENACGKRSDAASQKH